MEYKSIDKINQSLIKKILIHPSEFVNEKKRIEKREQDKAAGIILQPQPKFVFGTAVDHLITEDTPFEDVFYIMNDAKKPSEAMVNIVTEIFNKNPNLDELENDRIGILAAAEKFDYGKTYKADTKIDKIIKSGSSYYKDLVLSKNKIIISNSEYVKVTIAVAALRTDPHTCYYLMKRKNIEIIKKPIYEFTFRGIEFKGEGDLIMIDHERRKIYPLDIKTTSYPAYKFKKSVLEFRYDFQGVFYNRGIKFHPITKPLIEQENPYTVENFTFLVVEKDCNNRPMVYQLSNETMQLGAHGGIVDDVKYEGISSAVDRYLYHLESGKWDHTREYYEHGKSFI